MKTYVKKFVFDKVTGFCKALTNALPFTGTFHGFYLDFKNTVISSPMLVPCIDSSPPPLYEILKSPSMFSTPAGKPGDCTFNWRSLATSSILDILYLYSFFLTWADQDLTFTRICNYSYLLERQKYATDIVF